MAAPDDLGRALDLRLRSAQAEGLPSISAAVVRRGEIVWSGSVGLANLEDGVAATPQTQYRIGSITKTFTAVAVMQLRERGLVDLDDRLDAHLPGVAHGGPTLRRLLAHLSGLQREAGDMWMTGQSPSYAELLDVTAKAEQVLDPGQAFHYSNLAFALLGQVVAARGGMPYTEWVDTKILEPLKLARTTWLEEAPVAHGYLVHAYDGGVSREPHIDTKGVSAMGQLWSTVDELARWATFLASGHDDVLPKASVERMWFPQVMVNPDEWVAAYGLGLKLVSRGGTIYGGHGGAMPGHLAGVFINRASGVGAAVLTNSGARGVPEAIAIDLAEKTRELWPEQPTEWRPEDSPPEAIRALLGRWWSEGDEFVFSWREGALQASPAGAPASVKPAVFAREADGVYRSIAGYERGEKLVVVGVSELAWGGYRFTREQESWSL